MRIIAGTMKGRRLLAPAGPATRPTADRTRQAIFDMVMHADWGGRALVEGATVLDAFAGTGAMGLEALSRGAQAAIFMEHDPGSLAVLRANITACGAHEQSRILPADVLKPPPGVQQTIVFLDPPYGAGLLTQALSALRRCGWIACRTLVVAECGRLETCPYTGVKLAHRLHGAAQINVWRES